MGPLRSDAVPQSRYKSSALENCLSLVLLNTLWTYFILTPKHKYNNSDNQFGHDILISNFFTVLRHALNGTSKLYLKYSVKCKEAMLSHYAMHALRGGGGFMIIVIVYMHLCDQNLTFLQNLIF
jgi:hypothetical protein